MSLGVNVSIAALENIHSSFGGVLEVSSFLPQAYVKMQKTLKKRVSVHKR